MVEIAGTCDERFTRVRDAFAANFAEGQEIGAAFALAMNGRLVVDLRAGYADRAGHRPFTAEVLTPIFSTTKAVTALMVARLVDRGALAYEQRVAEIWPEFGQAGKDRVTVGQLMSHQAGLPGFARQQDPSIWFDREAVLRELCAQAPMWPPGTASGYHPVTGGYLIGEIFRRIDGRTIGAALAEDFARPFGLDVWIGLPDSEHGRCAEIRKPTSLIDLGELDSIKRSAFLDKGSSPGGRETAEWKRMEIPSANGHATAAALARLMGVIATSGVLDGTRVLSADTVAQAVRERIRGRDKVLPFELSWAAGFMRNAGVKVYGPGEQTVGHSGWGGSCAFADPQRGLSGAYVMNRQSALLIGDPRAVRLADAVYASL